VGVDFVADNDNFIRRTKQAGNQVKSFEAKTTKGLAKVDRAFGKTNKMASAFGKKMKAAIGVAAVTGLAYGIVRMTKAAVEFGDSIDKASKVAGISAVRLQELRYAAEQSGVKVRELDEGVRRFTRRLGAAQRGEGFVAGFTSLIGDPQQFAQAEDALNAAIVAIANLENQQQRAQAASIVFGDDAGPKLALLMGQGTDAIDAMTQKAHDLGLILSNEAVANAAAAGDAIATLTQQFKIATAEAILQNADALAQLTEMIAASIPTVIEGIKKWGEFFGLFDNTFERQMDANAKRMAEIRRILDPDRFGPKPFPALANQLRAELEHLDNENRRLKDEITMRDAKIRERQQAAAVTTLTGTTVEGTAPVKTDPLDALAESIKREIESPLDTYNRKLQELQELKAAGKITTEELTKAEALYGEQLQTQLAALAEAPDAFDKYIESLGATEEAMQGLAIDTMRGFEDALVDVIMGAEKAGEAFKAFAKTVIAEMIRIATQQLIIKPLMSLFGFGGGGMGFATGGSFIVPGSGGPDSQFVGFMATPGEEVAVRTPGQQRMASEGGAGAVIIEMHNHFDVGLESVDERIAQATPIIAEEAQQAVYQAVARGGQARRIFNS
jgi:hypothetical protein